MRFERITTDPSWMAGAPCIRDLRLPVATIIRMVADGMSFDDLLTEYPDLAFDDIRQALHFAAQAVTDLAAMRPATA